MISGDGYGQSFPDIRLMVEEKLQEKPQPGKLTRPGIKPRSAKWDETMSPLDHSGGS